MATLVVDGIAVTEPTGITYGLQDISSPDAGRTQDTIMHKNRTGQKVTLDLEWTMVTPEEAASILQAFDPEYIFVTYHDAKLNATVTKEFYSGDKTAPVKEWSLNNRYYNKITFKIIER